MTFGKASEVIRTEAEALMRLSNRLDQSFLDAIEMIAQCRGRVIVTGMGKTGIIARKISATFSSTGTPSIFIHSAEAVHGDLGQVTTEDVIIILSNSGETQETKRLIPLIRRIGIPIIGMTGNPASTLGKECDICLDVSVDKEGCPLDLAPMASTTTTMVLGHALAACLIIKKDFRREDFAFYHPGGSLGRKLLLKVSDIMRTGPNLAVVKENAPIKSVLLSITRARCGSACVVNENGRLIGLFTDGDLRRQLESNPDILNSEVGDVMTKDPVAVQQSMLAADALTILQSKQIDELPVIEGDQKLVGLLDVQDVLKAGLV